MKILFLSNYETYYYGSDDFLEGLILLIVLVGLLFFIYGLNKNKKNNVETTDTKSGNSVESNQNQVAKSPSPTKEDYEDKFDRVIGKSLLTESDFEIHFKFIKLLHDGNKSGRFRDEEELRAKIVDFYSNKSPKEIAGIMGTIMTIGQTIGAWINAVENRNKIKFKGTESFEQYNSLAQIIYDTLRLDMINRAVDGEVFEKSDGKSSSTKSENSVEESKNLNPNQSVIPKFNEFSESEKKLVYHIALIRAMGEVMRADDVLDPNEVHVFAGLSEKSKKESNLNYTNDEFQNLKEYKYIWGDPVDFENNENLIIAIKNMGENDINNFFEKLILIAVSDLEFHPNEKNYIRDLYSSCKGVSKQKSTTWLNSKIKEMGLKFKN